MHPVFCYLQIYSQLWKYVAYVWYKGTTSIKVFFRNVVFSIQLHGSTSSLASPASKLFHRHSEDLTCELRDADVKVKVALMSSRGKTLLQTEKKSVAINSVHICGIKVWTLQVVEYWLWWRLSRMINPLTQTRTWLLTYCVSVAFHSYLIFTVEYSGILVFFFFLFCTKSFF